MFLRGGGIRRFYQITTHTREKKKMTTEFKVAAGRRNTCVRADLGGGEVQLTGGKKKSSALLGGKGRNGKSPLRASHLKIYMIRSSRGGKKRVGATKKSRKKRAGPRGKKNRERLSIHRQIPAEERRIREGPKWKGRYVGEC